ncbi:hypothetical protein SteCoe_15085 [Stentor coeruleus]|uniref:Uncharacterized protein n=1 Tax=Stentor coeruleus TaxID=5963 RepID=A0A1R2C4R6_9CILI|nr:hypothetical protein SteCoe_15085 [Stentor coeruleus]
MEAHYKFVLLGDAETGKTTFLSVLVNDRFLNEYEGTIGAAYMGKNIENETCRLMANFWDTSGNPRYHCLARMYYRDANACIIFYDITNSESFTNAKSYIQEVRDTSPNVIFFVLGNKVDLIEKRAVAFDEAKKYFTDLGISFWEISCKNSSMITETMNLIAFKVINSNS